MALEAIIFAVDGVIADTHEARREAFNKVFSEAGLGWHWDRATYAQLLRSAGEQELVASALIEAFLRGRVTRPRHLGDLSNMIAAMERRHASLLRDRFTCRHVEFRSGIASFLLAAAREQIDLAIVTRGDDDNVHTLLETRLPLELSAAMEVVAFEPNSDLESRETEYLEVATLLDVDIRSCLVVESSVSRLVEARVAGMAGLLTWGLYPRMDEITSVLSRANTPSIADATSFFLSRWDCAPPSVLLSYIRDVHSMQCRLLCSPNAFIPSSAILDKEVDNVGLRYLEA